VTTRRRTVPRGTPSFRERISRDHGNLYHSDTRPVAKTLAENVKDTIESIVVAFILAFVFRAFIVEAFVIPTVHGRHALRQPGHENMFDLRL